MVSENITIKCPDGISLCATVFSPENPPLASVVFASALGVPRQFYRAFAAYLADNGIAALTFDYRGVGDSFPANGDVSRLQMADWGKLDINAVLAEAGARFKTSPLFLLGHSCGGQLFGLAPHSKQLAGVILVSAQLANWRLWPLPSKLGMLLLWHVLIPVLCTGRTIFPARKLGLSSVDVPSSIVAQWARWARQPQYLFAGKFDLNRQHYNELSCPVLAYTFDDDGYAPLTAAEALLARLPNAIIDLEKVRASELNLGKIGHFGYFKEKAGNALWPRTLAWLYKIAGENKAPTNSNRVNKTL